MDIPYTLDEFKRACIDAVAANDFDDCYLRPVIYRGFHSLGVAPPTARSTSTIAAWKWGKYLGAEALEEGVDVRVSSWNRMAPNTFPALAKATANYMNSILIRMEASADGYSEGIALDVNGYVSEGSGENVFLVRNGSSSPRPSAPRCSPASPANRSHIARDLGFQIDKGLIPREPLYIADEVFFTGTAAEVTPIRTVDQFVGTGRRGPVTDDPERVLCLHPRRDPGPLQLAHAGLSVEREESDGPEAGVSGGVGRLRSASRPTSSSIDIAVPPRMRWSTSRDVDQLESPLLRFLRERDVVGRRCRAAPDGWLWYSTTPEGSASSASRMISRVETNALIAVPTKISR